MQQAYINGTIITMEEALPLATAILIEAGKIQMVGTTEEILQKNQGGQIIDLQGKTMLPGFVESHGHSISYAESRLYADLSIENGVNSIYALQDQLRQYLQETELSPEQWLLGGGYDNAYFENGRHPNKFDLDKVSTEIPIVCQHVSGHVGAANSKALELLHYYDGCPNPDRGVLQRLADGKKINGVLEGGALYNPEVLAAFGTPSVQQVAASFLEVQQEYASYGITTATEAYLSKEGYGGYHVITYGREHGMENLIDIIGYPYYDYAFEALEQHPVEPTAYEQRFRFGGTKLLLDGSPQAKTAWLSQPYYVIPEGKPDNYCGAPLWTDEAARDYFVQCIQNGWSVHVHCNGDAACEQFLRTYGQAQELCGGGAGLRQVMIHCQTIRSDQIERMKTLGILASVFVDHVYYWGDWHYASVLGPERAQRISPVRTIMSQGINCTLHQDPPIRKTDMLLTVHNAVNRITMQGRILGEEEKISSYAALQAITIYGAYQCFEEQRKGSLKPGKLADLVILDYNPLTVPPEKIRQIQVLETIKEGKTIYKRI